MGQIKKTGHVTLTKPIWGYFVIPQTDRHTLVKTLYRKVVGLTAVAASRGNWSNGILALIARRRSNSIQFVKIGIQARCLILRHFKSYSLKVMN